ncbi:MAG TPA: alkaline phosphatase family protein [Solirubrobacterales bacterium]|nr:alkaline phosphatase family protein [Solirubrobacterales bacterium]
MSFLSTAVLKAAAAAETLTGKKFAVLVASSLVATSGIVAVGANSAGGMSPMEAAALQALAEQESALAAAPAEPEESFTPASSPEPAASPGPISSAPAAAPAPIASEPAPAPEEETPVAPPTEPEAEPGPIQHVFLVSLASPGYDATFGTASQMPYLSATLRPQGVLLTNYSLLDTAPLPNGIATVSGQPPSAATKAGCPKYEECVQEVETLTLADQLVGAHLHWHGYIEAMQNPEAKPESCVAPEPEAAVTPTPSGYSPLLNPFIFFHSLLDLGDCDENDVPLDALAGDLKKTEKTANFSYISPSLCNAGFRGNCPEGTPDGPAAADAFLAKVVPEILASPAYKKDGLLIVSFGAADPGAATDPATAPPDPLEVGGLLLSPLLTPGGTDGAAYDPYSVLRSIEDLFALEPLGKAGGAKVKTFSGAFLTANGGD